MFLAALDLLDRPWGGMRPQAQGEWERSYAGPGAREAPSVISHEILAGAKPAEAARALADLDFAEVHVVYTARDVARQVAAEWQEQLKHQRKVSFRTFLRQIRETDQRKATRWFWRVQGLPGVLRALGQRAAAGAGARGDGAAARRAATASCGAGSAQRSGSTRPGRRVDSERRNPSIGDRREHPAAPAQRPAQGRRAALRPVPRAGPSARRARDPRRPPGMQPVTLPPGAYDWAEEVAQTWIDWVKGAGVDVVGDLEELRPLRPAPGTEWQDPDRPRPRDVGSAGLDALRRAHPGGGPPARSRRHARRAGREARAAPPAMRPRRPAAWAWVAHLRGGRYDALGGLVARPSRRPRAGSCPAPSSSSCSAASTSRAGPRPRWSSGC